MSGICSLVMLITFVVDCICTESILQLTTQFTDCWTTHLENSHMIRLILGPVFCVCWHLIGVVSLLPTFTGWITLTWDSAVTLVRTIIPNTYALQNNMESAVTQCVLAWSSEVTWCVLVCVLSNQRGSWTKLKLGEFLRLGSMILSHRNLLSAAGGLKLKPPESLCLDSDSKSMSSLQARQKHEVRDAFMMLNKLCFSITNCMLSHRSRCSESCWTVSTDQNWTCT